VLPVHLARIRHDVWVTRPNKAMLSTVSVSAVEVASGQCQRVLPTVRIHGLDLLVETC